MLNVDPESIDRSAAVGYVALFAFAALSLLPSGCSPRRAATAGAVQLSQNEAIGKAAFANNPSSGLPDTTTGGHGQRVAGIPCGPESGRFHGHAHLALFVNGKQIQIPAGIGAVQLSKNSGCFYWIHTHDATGIIHLEAPRSTMPDGGRFRLGILFKIWGMPLGRNRVGPFIGPVSAYINGTRYSGDPRNIWLHEGRNITLELGQPHRVPPRYLLPPGY